MNIRADAADIIEVLERIAVPVSGDTWFDPIPLVFEPDPNGDDAIKSAVASEHNSALTVATVGSVPFQGSGKVVVDAAELLDYLGRFDGEVSVEFSEDAILIDGDKKDATLYPRAAEASVPPGTPTRDDDGRVLLRDEPCEVVVDVDASDLRDVTRDAKTLDVDVYPITRDDDGLHVELGSLQSKHNRIQSTLDHDGTGQASTIVGQDFAHVVSVLDGPIELQFRDDSPVVVIWEDGADEHLYVCSPVSER